MRGLEILAKSLRPLPDKWHGLARRRPGTASARWTCWPTRTAERSSTSLQDPVRAARPLATRSFLEVETPVLQPQAGGAIARPFFTHSNALDTEFSLRIAPELYLKRLVVGGYERVFEIARNFRNEGIDTRHSPEFTSLEAYRAFGDFHDGMDLTEHLITEAAREAAGKLEFDFGWPARRPDAALAAARPPRPARRRLGQRVHPSMPVGHPRDSSEANDVPYLPSWGSGKLIFELYDKILIADRRPGVHLPLPDRSLPAGPPVR